MNNQEISWGYGITTVPSRIDTYLPQTIESLGRAGFDCPHLFVDGIRDISDYECFDLHITNRWPKIRTVANWVLGAWELLFRYPDATHYAMFEDDLVTCRGLKNYL